VRLGQGIGLGLAVALLAAQLVPVERTNPPVQADVVAPPEVKALLRRACFDCHSGETVWPWYAWVAPVSWLVAHDVNHGREELDFSGFEADDAARQRKKLRETAAEVEEGEMPPWYYVLLHPEARLDDAAQRQLVDWANAERGRRGGKPALP
jgi:mono/diheme cytochrome c family protein